MVAVRRSMFVVVMFVGLTACGDGDADDDARAEEPAAHEAAGSNAVVTVETFNFQPDPITVKAGTTITFTNKDKIDHTVTAGTRDAPTRELFDGQLPNQGATFALTLAEPGTYDYFCDIHAGPGMTAKIIVE